MEMRIIKPTSEEIIKALRVCMRDTPSKASPCDECYLNRLSRGGLMSTGRPCFEHLAFDVIELIQRKIIENANLKVKIAQAERKISNLRERLNDIGEEITDCNYDCEGDPSVGIQACKFWIAPDVDETDMPIPGYCSVREEMRE